MSDGCPSLNEDRGPCQRCRPLSIVMNADHTGCREQASVLSTGDSVADETAFARRRIPLCLDERRGNAFRLQHRGTRSPWNLHRRMWIQAETHNPLVKTLSTGHRRRGSRQAYRTLLVGLSNVGLLPKQKRVRYKIGGHTKPHCLRGTRAS